MNVYVRKILKHDITHQISITREILEDYFGNPANNDYVMVRGKKSRSLGKVTFLLATDPRFGGDIKQIIKAEGDMQVDDMLIFSKSKGEYTLEVISVDDERYPVLNTLFADEKRHLVFNLDQPSDTEDDTEKEDRITGGTNLLFYGVPGSGKSYAINKICSNPKFMTRVVFHPDYTYSDFTGQILPRVESVNGEERLKYVFSPGPFTEIMKAAQNDPSNMYYLVIEEINRGNAPAIFGEIFQLLDRNETGESQYSICNYDIAKAVYDDPTKMVSIPSNLSVMATMNTSDQNVFTLDTAFQRRWIMRHIPNIFSEKTDRIIEGSNITWNTFANTVNDMVINSDFMFVGNGDKRLGAYFILEKEAKRSIFPEKVLKYLWDDAFKMNREDLFKAEYKSVDQVIYDYEHSSGDTLETVLNEDVYYNMRNFARKSSSDEE